jgi:hypothetical protein
VSESCATTTLALVAVTTRCLAIAVLTMAWLS